ncbi:MAG TPA: hypothetical protein VMW54_08635 [Terriglobia bacterium]|nr:hypothetical protein [Terriglobia bacterium]
MKTGNGTDLPFVYGTLRRACALSMVRPQSMFEVLAGGKQRF